jgi:hypothetical protein
MKPTWQGVKRFFDDESARSTHRETVRAAMERAQGGHSDPQAAEDLPAPPAESVNAFSRLTGRGEWIRTTDLLVPNYVIRLFRALSGVPPCSILPC